MKKQFKDCPSSVAAEGALLLGIVNEDGSVGYINTKIEVTSDLLDDIIEKGEPERRFRFSNKCVETGCRQWDNGNCGVIKKVMADMEVIEQEPSLPQCAIRESCRWYYQEGAVACSFCPYIITNMLKAVEVVP